MSVGRNDAVQTNENALDRCHTQCTSDGCQPRLRWCLILSRGLEARGSITSVVDDFAAFVGKFERALLRSCEHRPLCPGLHEGLVEGRAMHRKWWRGNSRIGRGVTCTGSDGGCSMIRACVEDAGLGATVDASPASARTGLGAQIIDAGHKNLVSLTEGEMMLAGSDARRIQEYCGGGNVSMYPPTRTRRATQRRSRTDARISGVATDHRKTPVPATFLAP